MIFLVFLAEQELQKSPGHNFDKYIGGEFKNCGPSATVDKDGNCKCLFFGNPNDEIGCYDCRPQCGEGSYCSPPAPTNNTRERIRPNRGICKCLDGFYFNENSLFFKCKVAIPFITTYYPVRGPVNTVINFTLKSLAGFSSPNIYCKFNNTITNGTKWHDNFVQCTIPKDIESDQSSNTLFLALSYDRKNWTALNIPFEVTGLKGKVRITPVLIFGAVLSAIGVVLIAAYLHYGLTGNEGSGAGEPLLNRGEKY